MPNNTILITGANGEIGQDLIKRLNLNPNNKIIALDLKTPIHNNTVEKFIKGSILDKEIIENIFNQYNINEIYHLAAILSTKAEENPDNAYNVNFKGTEQLLQIALNSKSDTIKFFFPSSIAVYNVLNIKNKKSILENECNDNPITIYGQTKLRCEKLGGILKNSKIDFRCIRFPGIISATSMPSGGTSDYVPEMIHSAAQNKDYFCFVNKNTTLPFIVMPDAINAIIKIMGTNKNNLKKNVYNITSFSQTAEQFSALVKQYYNKCNIKYKIDKKRQGIVNSWPESINQNAAINDWGWTPEYNLLTAFNIYLIPTITTYYKSKKGDLC